VTVYVEGTLSIAANVTITGGGTIVKQGSGVIFVTNSASALASNNSRKLARDGNGNYHLVFETDGEVCYEKLTNGGTAIGEFRQLSYAPSGGAKTNPAIAERDGNIFVVWQKNTGSSHDITFHKSTDGGATWPGNNRKTLATGVGANSPLPVIVSPATNQLMVVYRTSSNLSYLTSTDDGNTWSAVTAVPSTGIHAAHQSMAVTTTYWGSIRTALVNTNTSGNGTIYYRYYKNARTRPAGSRR
jgi:Neuraminidase (sialidase)